MNLSYRETMFILELIRKHFGSGYAKDEVGKLQAKLSINLEVRASLGDDTETRIPKIPKEIQ